MTNNSEHRIPPQNLEAEMSVLGAIMLDNDVMPMVTTDINADDFYRSTHAQIYRAMQALSAEGEPIDLVTVTSKLKADGKLEETGGSAYLSQLVDYVPTAANVGYYTKLVRQHSIARSVIRACTEIAAEAYNPSDADELLASSMAHLEAIGSASPSSGRALLTLQDLAAMYTKHVQTLDETRFITGLPEVDGIIRGCAPGEVLMVVGYSGLFKSAILHNMLLNACNRTRRHHLFFSLEMPGVRVFERTVQIALEHYTYNVESGFHHHQGYPQTTMKELAELGADKLITCEESGLTIERIEHYTRLARNRFGELGAIGIDYLGLMSAEDAKSEYERISYVAENSKHLAKRLNVPVIILTQVNRASASDGQVEKWSAKGSGAVEASADYMLGLQRTRSGDLQLKILKNRNGEENITFDVDLEAKYLKVRSATPHSHMDQKNADRGMARLRRGHKEQPEGYDPY